MWWALIIPGECLMQGRHPRALLRAQGVGRSMPLMSASFAQCGLLLTLSGCKWYADSKLCRLCGGRA